MNKFTKIALGVGLAAAALGATVSPATAAPTTTAIGDRVEGSFEYWGASSTVAEFVMPFIEGQVPSTGMGVHGDGVHTSFPAKGESGEIRSNNLCLELNPGAPTDSQWAVTAEKCDGSLLQLWGITNVNPVWNEPGWMNISNLGSQNHHQLYVSTANGAGVGPRGLYGISDTFSHPAAYSSLTPVVAAVTPVDITGPAQNEITLRNPVFTGTGDEGAEVVVRDAAGNELCTATVTGGAWSCTSGIDLADGPVDVTATQTATDGSVSTDTVSIIIADPLNSPVIDPMLAGGAGVALLALAGTAFAARRKQTANV